MSATILGHSPVLVNIPKVTAPDATDVLTELTYLRNRCVLSCEEHEIAAAMFKAQLGWTPADGRGAIIDTWLMQLAAYDDVVRTTGGNDD